MSNIILKRIAKINPKFQKGKLFHRDNRLGFSMILWLFHSSGLTYTNFIVILATRP